MTSSWVCRDGLRTRFIFSLLESLLSIGGQRIPVINLLILALYFGRFWGLSYSFSSQDPVGCGLEGVGCWDGGKGNLQS